MGSTLVCSDANRQELTERYLFGGMRKKQKLAFEQHLKECEACQKQLQQSQQMLNELRQAAENAGWSPGEIDQLSRLYAPRGVFSQFNWRLVLVITLVLFAVFVLPFIWWANKPETKMRLLASLEPEYQIEGTLPEELNQAIEAHQSGNHDRAIQELMHFVDQPTYQPFWPLIHRVIGLSFMLKKEPERALPYLQKSLANASSRAEEKSLWYIANAYLMLGNRSGAMRFLQEVIEQRGQHQDRARAILDRLKKL